MEVAPMSRPAGPLDGHAAKTADAELGMSPVGKATVASGPAGDAAEPHPLRRAAGRIGGAVRRVHLWAGVAFGVMMTAFGVIASSTNVNAILCRDFSICLFGAAAVAGVEPLSEELSLVTLNLTLPAGALRGRGAVLVLPVSTGEASTRALVLSAAPVRSGMRLSERAADAQAEARFAASLAALGGRRLAELVSDQPGLAGSAAVADQTAAALDTGRAAEACPAAADGAWALTAREALGRPAPPLEVALARLRARALGCSPDAFPPDW